MTAVTFGVITRVGPGTLAAVPDLRQTVPGDRSAARDWEEHTVPVFDVNLRRPVFTVGEILILGPDGREIGYPGRKPAKWDVDCERFTLVVDAAERARQVLS